MHPVLFHIGDSPVSTYGVLLAIGFVSGTSLAVSLAARTDVSRVHLIELCCWLAIGGSVGSRVFFALQNWEAVSARPALFFELWTGGAVWYGGVLGGLIALASYVAIDRRLGRKRLGVSAWTLGDIVMPATSLGHLFGRLGCFSAGCCWGQHAAELPWAVTFPASSRCGLPGVALHPTQLYEAGGELMILGLLLAVWRRRRFPGQVFLTYFLTYPVLRLLVEPFRGDVVRGFVLGSPISIAQALSIGLVIAAALVYRWRRSQWQISSCPASS